MGGVAQFVLTPRLIMWLLFRQSRNAPNEFNTASGHLPCCHVCEVHGCMQTTTHHETPYHAHNRRQLDDRWKPATAIPSKHQYLRPAIHAVQLPLLQHTCRTTARVATYMPYNCPCCDHTMRHGASSSPSMPPSGGHAEPFPSRQDMAIAQYAKPPNP